MSPTLPMKIKKATRLYEEWLGAQTRLVSENLERKYRLMASGLFPFMRSTFYRWVQRWPEVCAAEARAPTVLAIGDLHVENFGTWRDSEGRLVWGVNDFDEAAWLPFTSDLTRLAASVHLAIAASSLTISGEDACSALLDGYASALHDGGAPFVLEERHGWLRALAQGSLRDPKHFWKKMDELPSPSGEVPESAREALEYLLPTPLPEYRVARRVAGMGSLGHQRFVALADWNGGRIAREAKALVPSAAVWARQRDVVPEILYPTIIRRARRATDPLFQIRGHWIVRRLAPDCSRVELATLPAQRDEVRMVRAMGAETANLHLGTREAMDDVRHFLKARPDRWLHDAAGKMLAELESDWHDWRSSREDSDIGTSPPPKSGASPKKH